MLRSGKLFGIYAELLHPRKQCRTIDAQTFGGSSGAANTAFGLAEDTYDLLALLLIKFFSGASRTTII